jgi:hypothetical protein
METCLCFIRERSWAKGPRGNSSRAWTVGACQAGSGLQVWGVFGTVFIVGYVKMGLV